MALTCACHAFGWPVARGGSRAITDALAAELREHGGTIETGRRVASLDELPRRRRRPARPLPRARRRRRRRRLPPRSRAPTGATATGRARSRSTSRSRAACRGRTRRAGSAGTVHVVGTFEETVAAEARGQPRADARAAVRPGRPAVPRRPGRSAGDVHPVWAYAHVPERLGGRRDRGGDRPDRALRARASASGSSRRSRSAPAEFEAYNANYIGGDIIAGANTPRQIVSRPRLALDPYATGIPGVYICSAATPPGAGVHGMNGSNAARAALKRSSFVESAL